MTSNITRRRSNRTIRTIKGAGHDRLFSGIVYAIITLFAVACLIPFWLMFINSFATESAIARNGFALFPKEFSGYAYQFLFQNTRVLANYRISITVTVCGTVAAVCVTSMFAYAISNRKMKYGNVLSFLTYFTMLLGSGLVGFYILMVNWLHLKDSLLAMILPYLMNPFFVFVLVAFYRGIPYELNEAATIDGANDAYTFFRIIIPVAAPSIATVTLFFALQYWNDYFLALMFIDDYKLYPLQMMIRLLISNINAQQFISGSRSTYSIQIPTYGVQLATVCVTVGPIILLYPFLQKHFVKGLTLGAVKG
ncbi:sugar ABC transporter permease [Clostridia bacterium]|nr:sugar ABC transporter permease [Clostridia bacterium]